MLTYSPGTKWRRDLNNFYQGICEQPFRAGVPAPGILQTLLKQGDYGVLGNVPIFESTFLQVTKRGEYISIHNHPNIITMGILASSPRMLLPNLLIIAQEKKATDQKTKELEIKRLIPLELVDIFIHNLSRRRLKVQMITGRKYYLQLCAPEEEESFLFERWVRLIYLLRTTRGSVRTPVTSTDPTLRTIWKAANIPRQVTSGSKKHFRLPPLKIKDSTVLFKEKQKKKRLSGEMQKRRYSVPGGLHTQTPNWKHYLTTTTGEASTMHPLQVCIIATEWLNSDPLQRSTAAPPREGKLSHRGRHHADPYSLPASLPACSEQCDSSCCLVKLLTYSFQSSCCGFANSMPNSKTNW